MAGDGRQICFLDPALAGALKIAGGAGFLDAQEVPVALEKEVIALATYLPLLQFTAASIGRSRLHRGCQIIEQLRRASTRFRWEHVETVFIRHTCAVRNL